MKIYTKFGDKGFTSLFSGKKVKKHNIRVDTYGNVDELNANLGMLRDIYGDKSIVNDIIKIQKNLFIIGSELATPKKVNLDKIIGEEDIIFLENRIDEITEKLPKMTHFILPGGNIVVSQCHISRTICRRSERKISLMKSKKMLTNELCLKYINRLSDYIFTLSRKYANDNDIEEIKWIP